MNGPLKMFRMKPIVRYDTVVELPDCMYRMQNIHASKNGTVEVQSNHIVEPKKKIDISDQNNALVPEMAALEARQEQILQQLAELKKQMSNIRSQLKIKESFPSSTIMPACNAKISLPADVIINASPTYPPYSLLKVQELWQSSVGFIVKTFLHSSVSSLNEKAALLSRSLEAFSPKAEVNKVNVRLIWKDVGANTELIVSPMHTPILGEVNVLRYLARLNPSSFPYENLLNPEEIDSLLDTSYSIVRAKTKTERGTLLQNLNKSLGKSQFLSGRNAISVADLAAFSAIKQVTSANEINVGLGKWLQRCESC